MRSAERQRAVPPRGRSGVQGEHEQARTRLRALERDLTLVGPSSTARELHACRDAATRLDLAREVYALRTKADRSQAALAKRARTSGTFIGGLNDADYENLGFAKLGPVAAALERRLEVRFVSPGTHRAARGGSRSAAR